MCVKNDVFDASYEDYVRYKDYVNDIINTLIPKEDSLHRTEKENTAEHHKNIELLENQVKDLKRENQILKGILTSKFEKNNDNSSNGSKIPGRRLKPTELIGSITRETTENLTQLALKK